MLLTGAGTATESHVIRDSWGDPEPLLECFSATSKGTGQKIPSITWQTENTTTPPMTAGGDRTEEALEHPQGLAAEQRNGRAKGPGKERCALDARAAIPT